MLSKRPYQWMIKMSSPTYLLEQTSAKFLNFLLSNNTWTTTELSKKYSSEDNRYIRLQTHLNFLLKEISKLLRTPTSEWTQEPNPQLLILLSTETTKRLHQKLLRPNTFNQEGFCSQTWYQKGFHFNTSNQTTYIYDGFEGYDFNNKEVREVIM